MIEPLKILPDARPELPDAGVLSGGKRFITITDTHVRRPNLNPLNVSDTSFKAYFRSNSIIVYDMFMKDTADDKLRFTPSTTTTFTSIKFYKDTSKPLDNILIVIDGKEHPDIKSSTDINGMDPNDISSMNVLKGASAISKYGSKGKYGVIEIFTKKERDKFVAKAPTIKAANEATKTTDTTLSTKDYNNLTNWNYDDPEFRIWRQKAIAEIKTIARNEQKTVYIYKGRTYIFANDEATNFTEMDGINHPLMLNGNFVSNVDKMNSLVKRQDIKKIGFISKEDALRLYNIDDYITTVTSW